MASKSLDIFMKSIGMNYVKETLASPVSHIFHAKKACELDPQVKKKTSIEKSVKRLIEHLNLVMDSIFKSISHCPK